MENPEEILHSLEEFSKMKPKDIPRELEEYLAFVAKTGDPIYQWGSIKSLFREKLISVITEFYDSCPVMEIPPCPNVDLFNYDLMKNFILEKLEAFNSAPFTLQRICELLTTPRKEYNRIDKFMRAIEKNILVVSTVEPGGRRSNENGDGIMNGIENDPPVPEPGAEINIEEMDESPSWGQDISTNHVSFDTGINSDISTSNQECIISCTIVGNQPYVSIEPLPTEALLKEKADKNTEISEETRTPEQTEITVKAVSAPDITEELIVSDIVAEATSETQVQDKIVVEKVIPMAQEEENDDSLQVDQTVEKSEDTEEKLIERSEVNSVLKNATSEPVEIDNISPETSTESSETLEASTNVQSIKVDEKIPENEEDIDVSTDKQDIEETKQEIEVDPAEKQKSHEENALKNIKVSEKIEETEKKYENERTDEHEKNDDIKKIDDTNKIDEDEKIDKDEKIDEDEKIEEDVKIDDDDEKIIDDDKKIIDDIEKIVENEKIDVTEKIDENKEIGETLDEKTKEDGDEQGDIKIDIDTDPVAAEIDEKAPEDVKESAQSVEISKESEKTEIAHAEVEPMNVVDSEPTEAIADQKIDVVTASETDPLKIEDIVVDSQAEIEKIVVDSEQPKAETPKIEECTGSTPMEVDVVEEKNSESTNEPKKDVDVVVREEKAADPDQNKSDS